jgi:hypothetical protein
MKSALKLWYKVVLEEEQAQWLLTVFCLCWHGFYSIDFANVYEHVE